MNEEERNHERAVGRRQGQIEGAAEGVRIAADALALKTPTYIIETGEVERLRGLIRAVVRFRLKHSRSAMRPCPICDEDHPDETPHLGRSIAVECPWPALVAEAEKP